MQLGVGGLIIAPGLSRAVTTSEFANPEARSVGHPLLRRPKLLLSRFSAPVSYFLVLRRLVDLRKARAGQQQGREKRENNGAGDSGEAAV